MSLDDDYFDLAEFVDKHDGDDGYYLKALDRINDFNNEVSRENSELLRQIAALKAVITIKASDINITDPFGGGRYIHLELKNPELVDALQGMLDLYERLIPHIKDAEVTEEDVAAEQKAVNLLGKLK